MAIWSNSYIHGILDVDNGYYITPYHYNVASFDNDNNSLVYGDASIPTIINGSATTINGSLEVTDTIVSNTLRTEYANISKNAVVGGSLMAMEATVMMNIDIGGTVNATNANITENANIDGVLNTAKDNNGEYNTNIDKNGNILTNGNVTADSMIVKSGVFGYRICRSDTEEYNAIKIPPRTSQIQIADDNLKTVISGTSISLANSTSISGRLSSYGLTLKNSSSDNYINYGTDDPPTNDVAEGQIYFKIID